MGQADAIGHARYEYVRKLNPREFHDLYMRNIQNDERLDDLVDAAMSAAADGFSADARAADSSTV
jgi:hypothetical protein